MSSPAFWRLAWKEYRVQQPIWLSILLLAPLAMVTLAWWSPSLTGDPPRSVYHVVALVASCVFMLGCGATLFAGEDEAATLDLLRRFPVSFTTVVLSKSGIGVAAGLLLALLLWLLASGLGQQGLTPQGSGEYALAASVMGAELFAWSIGFSLLWRRVLWAAAAGVLVPSALLGLVYPILFPQEASYEFFGNHLSYLGPRFGLTLLVLALDVWLAYHWYVGTDSLWPAFASRGPAAQALPSLAASSSRRSPAVPWGGPRSRHLWLAWRQGRWILGTLVVGTLAWLAQALSSPDVDLTFSHAAILVNIGTVLCGLAAFGGDQLAHQFRFVVEQGLDPRQLWRLRQTFWGLVTVALVLVFSVTCACVADANVWTRYHGVLLLGAAPFCFYTLGQLCSFFLRRLVLASILPILLAPLLLAWLFTAQALQISLWIALLPAPCLLLATRWPVVAWYDERLTGKQAWVPLLLVAVPPSLIVIGVSLFRATEIPVVDPGFSVTAFRRHAPVIEPGARLLELCTVQPQDPLAGIRRQQALVEEVRRLAAEPATPLWNIDRETERSLGIGVDPSLIPVAAAVSHAALQDEQAGDLAGAWATLLAGFQVLQRSELHAHSQRTFQLPWIENQLFAATRRWASHPAQTPSSLRTAAQDLVALEKSFRGGEDSLKITHLAFERLITNQAPVNQEAYLFYAHRLAAPAPFLRWLPAERERSHRLLHHLTAVNLNAHERLLADLQAGRAVTAPWSLHRTSVPGWNADLARWQTTSFAPPSDSIWSGLCLTAAQRIIELRGTQLQLALAAYRLRTGQLPETLDKLVGDELPRLPHSPVTGKPFDYYRQGIDVPIERAYGDMRRIPAHTPLLWTPEMQDLYRAPGAQRLRADADVLNRGKIFVISCETASEV